MLVQVEDVPVTRTTPREEFASQVIPSQIEHVSSQPVAFDSSLGLSDRDQIALAQTRQHLTLLARDEFGQPLRDEATGEVIRKITDRPDGKSKRGVALGEEADRRAAREARDARRERMHVRRPDGSKRWRKIIPDRTLKAYEDIALETQESEPGAQRAIAEARYQASVGTATRHEVRRFLDRQEDDVEGHALVADGNVVFQIDADDELFETVPVMVGGIHGFTEIVSFEAPTAGRNHADPLEDPEFGLISVDDALEGFRRGRHVASSHLGSQWLDYGLARQDH